MEDKKDIAQLKQEATVYLIKYHAGFQKMLIDELLSSDKESCWNSLKSMDEEFRNTAILLNSLAKSLK